MAKIEQKPDANDRSLVSPDLGWVPVSRDAVARTTPNYRAKLYLWRNRRRKRRFWMFVGYFTLFAVIFMFSSLAFAGMRLSGEDRAGMLSYIAGKIQGAVFAKEPPLPKVFNGKRDLYVLLVGLDKEPPHRSDTVMVAHFDLVTYETRIMSVPRDLRTEFVAENGRVETDKLAHTHVYGGIDGVKSAIERTLGITPDYYAVVRIGGLAAIVDEIGGVEIDVEKDMRYRDRAQDLDIDLKKGLQWLDGEQAEDYSRFRHDEEGDNGRMRRQQQVIRAIIKELRRPRNLPKIPRVLQIAYDEKMLETDMRPDQWLSLYDAVRDMTPGKIQTMVLYSEPFIDGGISYQSTTGDEIKKADDFLANLSPPAPGADTPGVGQDGSSGGNDTGAANKDNNGEGGSLFNNGGL